LAADAPWLGLPGWIGGFLGFHSPVESSADDPWLLPYPPRCAKTSLYHSRPGNIGKVFGRGGNLYVEFEVYDAAPILFA
jgi:hypothetical protein